MIYHTESNFLTEMNGSKVECPHYEKGITVYTDGSKMASGTWAEINSEQPNMSVIILF